METLSIYAGGLAVILTLMTLVWIVSVMKRDASLVDPFWSLNFVAAALFYYSQTGGGDPRRSLLLLLVLIWGLRLSAYLFWRNWGKGEDYRYQNFREKYGPERYWWVSFFQVFMLQGVLAWLVSAPLLGGMQAAVGQLNWLDGVALVVWLIGFAFEAGGDWQLARFKADPANQGKLLTTGFWRYTRHPNYFGDAAQWWAFGLFGLAAGGWWTLFGPVVMTVLLLRVSGVSLLERSLKTSKPGYARYMARTNAFFPWFPKSIAEEM